MSFCNKNAAIVINQNDMRNNIIEKKVSQLFDNQIEMEKMAQNANKMIIKNAREHIISEIKKLGKC